MLALVFLAAIAASMLPVEGADKQFRSTVLSERIIHYPNDYVSLEIIGQGEDSILYMIIDREINAASDIMLRLKLERAGHLMFLPKFNEVNLCTLLWKEAHEPHGLQARYRTSQAFNLDGFECPVPEGSVKLVPWTLIAQHTFDDQFDCGIYNYELSLEQCRPYSSCTTLIVADLQVRITSDDCNND